MEEAIPVTRVHRSGGGFAHWLFLATADSDRRGNRAANLEDGHEWFSFRADRRYIVGPGSIHPNGSLYTVLVDVAPTPIPAWVCRWVAKHSQDNSPRQRKPIAVSEDFDFDEFLAHYGIEIVGGKDGWHTTRECPVAGYRHQNSRDTGFYYDGSTLGWKCFAQGCDGSSMSIGQVIRRLNQDHAPYLGPIWEANGDDHGLSDWAEDAIDDEEDLPAATPVISARNCWRPSLGTASWVMFVPILLRLLNGTLTGTRMNGLLPLLRPTATDSRAR